MYKLQVVLVPPSAANGGFQYPFHAAANENSQLLPSSIGANGSAILTGNRPELPNSGGSNANLFMSSFMSSHIPVQKLKRFLLFTQPNNSLLTLAEEIVAKCDKIYPHLAEPVELLSLQDSNECDLDPDFLVKDVFNVDNVVRAVLSRDIEVADDQVQTLYSVKRRRLNSNVGSRPSLTSNGSSNSQPNVLHIAKKRPHILRNSGAMRVSTPLANQIYPPASRTQLNSDYEDDDVADRSILPPPQPQSQPIRISSAVDSAKKVNFSENTISRSEAVDPDKSRQHRLPSGTPKREVPKKARTPNRTNPQDQMLLVDQAELDGSATPINTNKRITSGMLRIPEPKISEVEKELKQGPESPSAILPARPDRIPMKKHDAPSSDDEELSQSSSEDDQIVVGKRKEEALEPVTKPSASRQTSIADNNGSPIKDAARSRNVNLAKIPSSNRRITRKSSLENKVESLIRNSDNVKEASGRKPEEKRDDPLTAARKVSFSDDDEADGQRSGQDPNDTVRVNHAEPGNSSFQKSELLSMLKGNKFDIPSDFSKRSLKLKGGYFDQAAENTKTSSKDIINQRLQRSAAVKAAELLSSGKSRNQQPSSESEDDSSDIETDQSDRRVTVLENRALRKLNIHPLKEQVIGKSSQSPQEGEPDIGKATANIVDKGSSKNTLSSIPAAGADANDKTLVLNGKPSKTKGSKESSDQQDLKDKRGVIQPHESTTSLSSSTSPSQTTSESDVNSKAATKSAKAVSADEIPPKINKENKKSSLSSANRQAKSFQSPEFVEDSDNDSTNVSSAAGAEDTKQKSATKPPPPSVLKRKEEAEKKRKEREIMKKAREEESARKKAEKEDKRRERDEAAARKKAEREIKKKLKQEEAAKKRGTVNASKKSKDHKNVVGSAPPESATKNTKSNELNGEKDERMAGRTGIHEEGASESSKVSEDQEKSSEKGHANNAASVSLEPKDLSQYFNTGEKQKEAQKEASELASTDDKTPKLQQLKSQFISGGPAQQKDGQEKNKSPAQKGSALSESSDEELPDDESTSDENESSGSSSDDASAVSRKSRRGIVDTPKGAIISIPKNVKHNDISDLEHAPQSTQQIPGNETTPRSGTKVPVTRLMDMSSPIANGKSPSTVPNTSKPQAKPSRSLSSLSDLVSRGVPEVKEKSVKERFPSQAPSRKDDSGDDLSQDDSDKSDSEETSDSSDDSSDDDDSSNFISAKSASKALGRQKNSGSGFASLVKDSRKR
ncbi:LAFA_0E16226g1_1 [Lachancea sp. 'fantastica']|nr:LAFA_0E16226g1_1 [Lachancea sp. 'fantastica']